MYSTLHVELPFRHCPTAKNSPLRSAEFFGTLFTETGNYAQQRKENMKTKIQTLSHNACYEPSSDVVMLKCSTFRNDVNAFDVRVFFDRPTGVSYYTITLRSAVLRSCGFVSVRNACVEIRAFLRQMKCTSTSFTCKEYLP